MTTTASERSAAHHRRSPTRMGSPGVAPKGDEPDDGTIGGRDSGWIVAERGNGGNGDGSDGFEPTIVRGRE